MNEPGAIASVKVHGGLYLFSAGVLASMLLTHLVARKQVVSQAMS